MYNPLTGSSLAHTIVHRLQLSVEHQISVILNSSFPFSKTCVFYPLLSAIQCFWLFLSLKSSSSLFFSHFLSSLVACQFSPVSEPPLLYDSYQLSRVRADVTRYPPSPSYMSSQMPMIGLCHCDWQSGEREYAPPSQKAQFCSVVKIWTCVLRLFQNIEHSLGFVIMEKLPCRIHIYPS